LIAAKDYAMAAQNQIVYEDDSLAGKQFGVMVF
jgi:hypothetical protein